MEHDFTAYLNDLAPPFLPPEAERRPRLDPAFSIKPITFSMGTMQRQAIFKESFRMESFDRGILNMNITDRDEYEIFFRIMFSDYRNFDENDDPWPILQARCPVDDIESVYVEKDEYHRRDVQGRLTFTMRRPPFLEVDQRYHPSRAHVMRRATELDWSPDGIQDAWAGAPGTMPRGYWERTPMKFGLWLTYSFEFTCRRDEYDRVVNTLSRLRTLGRSGMEDLHVIDADDNPGPIPRSRRIAVQRISQRDIPHIGEASDFPDLEKLMDDPRGKYPFEARYLVLGLVADGHVLPTHVGELIHYLWPVSPWPNRIAALRSFFRLPRRALHSPDAIRQHVRRVANARPLKTPKDRIAMRRVVVTPTRVLLFPEAIEMGNRVVRAWPRAMSEGRFIRVGFADEDGRLRINKRMLEADAQEPETGVLGRIRNVLHNGIMVADRHYVYLAAGESQLKDHSCWMVCEDGDFTADRVRAQMGDFSKETTVAKYSARMGLCLSATCPVDELDEEDIEMIPDIQHGDGVSQKKYTYTDGVGNCSQDLANRCAAALGSDRKEPSAVQVRMGGVKGVLSVHPHLEANQVCIRPSMQKFASPLRGLGAMKVSGFAPAHLNRQAISIMESLGVNVQKLLEIYQAQIDRAETLGRDFAVLDTGRHPARHLYKNAFIPVVRMAKAGLMDEVLFKNVVACIKCQILRELKYKARILVNGGAYLLGVADEYDVLEEGQVYCAITPKGNSVRKVITGPCTIFRSPCVHPGDARKVTAVNHQAFEDYPLTNVIVFSTKKAKRDLPSMLGGGDLDGDFFTLIYDPDLQIMREYPAMDYTPAAPVPSPRISMYDVAEFVVEYMKGDVLGMISNCHQAVSDYLGPHSDQCLRLAQKCSDAVDFAKSGVTVNLEQELRQIRFPDYMDKPATESYASTRVLGMMYRLIEPAPTYEPETTSSSAQFDTRLARKRVLFSYLQRAGQMKHMYDVDMQGLMRMHNLDEAEVIAGVSVRDAGKVGRRAADDAMRGPVREGMEAIRATYRRQARRWVKENPSGGGMEGWAIAAYQVTHIEEHRRRHVDALNLSRLGTAAISDAGYSTVDEDAENGFTDVERREMISFPWLWAQEICDSLEDHDTIKEEEEPDEEEDEERQDTNFWINQWRQGQELDDNSDGEDEKKPFAGGMLPPPIPVSVPARSRVGSHGPRMSVPVVKREESEPVVPLPIPQAPIVVDDDEDEYNSDDAQDGIEYLRTERRVFDIDDD
ncbi:RNA-dependent RNA polymerase [Mycena chlorophos]|uniref:RNA-dependent RNA polymerase n=1 Tax=Mycena chlorophos TaxID=658473 RepID=A0A8H6W7H4_MYCCL|nr:RNA-dependent RNA polymerase [Mycena chlorophos]